MVQESRPALFSWINSRFAYNGAVKTALLTQDYFFWSKVDATAKTAGKSAIHAKTLDDVRSILQSTISHFLIDLRHPDFVLAIQACASLRIPTVGFVSHMDSETILAARNAGCTKIISKSQFSMNLREILTTTPDI